MIYPSELELLEFFGVEPERSDDVTLFRVADSVGVRLEFSYNDVDDSVQTALYVSVRCICVVSCERMSRFWIDQGTLHAEFSYSDHTVNVSVLVEKSIQVNWSTLRRA